MPLEPRAVRALLERIEACQEQLGPAAPSALGLARACLELATPDNPAPHVLTTLWTLAEMLGRSERTIQRHLLERQHRWSPFVRRFFDFSPNYDSLRTPGGGSRHVVSGTVVRFFPLGRLGPKARVKRWGSRDLALESREGRTKPSRSRVEESTRVSSYGTLLDEVNTKRWVFAELGSLFPSRGNESPVNPYRDTPANALPDAALADLELQLQTALETRTPAGLVRARWVETTARAIATRLGDLAFEDLWRRVLWVALRAERRDGTRDGFWCVKRAYLLALDAKREGVLARPAAWALEVVRREGLRELEQAFGTGS